MDYISDISFVDGNLTQLNIYGLSTGIVKMDIDEGQEIVFPIAKFIDILKLLTEITERG